MVLRFFILCLTAAVLASCNGSIETAFFTEAQPAGVQPLDAFPKRIQGKYIDKEQKSILYINAGTIIQIEDYDYGTVRKELDSTYSLSGDTLINTQNDNREKVILRGDSVLVHVHSVDTLFALVPGQVLKKFKGYYFLNWGSKEDGWNVVQLSLQKGNLVTAFISDSTAIRRLDELAEKPLDTISRQYTIRKKQFKTFIRKQGFTDTDTFTRIRP